MTIKDTLPLVGFPGGKRAYFRFLNSKSVLIKERAHEVLVEQKYFFYEKEVDINQYGKVVTRKKLFATQKGLDFLKKLVETSMPQIKRNIERNGQYK